MPIICTEKEIVSRPNQIGRLLLPLVNKKIAAKRDDNQTQSFIFGAFDGTSPTTSRYKDWRFKTIDTSFKASYFEIWNKDSKDKFILHLAYLTIYKGSRENEEEVLALHCDPNEPKASKIHKYKSGPHIHIKHSKEEKFSKAHISLNIGELEKVLNSLTEMETALKNAILMIKDEFINSP
jgi:hypothetical protein